MGAALAGAIFLGEDIGLVQAAGMILAVLSLAVLARSSTTPVEERPASGAPGKTGRVTSLGEALQHAPPEVG